MVMSAGRQGIEQHGPLDERPTLPQITSGKIVPTGRRKPRNLTCRKVNALRVKHKHFHDLRREFVCLEQRIDVHHFKPIPEQGQMRHSLFPQKLLKTLQIADPRNHFGRH
jgi:hypothetical protein